MAAFQRYREYYRLAADLIVTEEGLFKPDSVPEELSLNALYVEVVYRVVMTDEAGQLLYFDFDNPPAQNEDRETGGPVNVDGEEWYTDDGPATTPLELERRYSARLPTEWRARADQMAEIAVSRGATGNVE